jgi:hypothetical protein
MATINATVGGWSSILYDVTGVVTPYNIPFYVPANLNATGDRIIYGQGTAAGEIDTMYAALLGINNTTLTINLQNFTDPGGNGSTAFDRIREFLLYNPNTNAGYDVSAYASASNGWPFLPPSTSPSIARANGGFVRLSDPQSTGSGNGNVVTGSTYSITLATSHNVTGLLLVMLGGSAA